MMKNAFYFNLKALFVLKTSQRGLQLQYTYCLFSQSKDNQTIKFGQLIEYNKRTTFPQKVRRK